MKSAQALLIAVVLAILAILTAFSQVGPKAAQPPGGASTPGYGAEPSSAPPAAGGYGAPPAPATGGGGASQPPAAGYGAPPPGASGR